MRLLAVVIPPTNGEGIYNGINPLTEAISLFFVQATLILGFSNFFGLAGGYLRSPKVVFEILAGIILGPSALCRNQWFADAVFPAASLNYLSIVANIGLTFYLFIIGIELDTKLLMTHARKTAGIALSGMVVPFALGVAVSQTLINNLQPDQTTGYVSFFVFIGTAFSITAFPVLARILKEGGLIYTRPGTMALGAAALNDAIAWCLLALAISVANGGNMNDTGYIFGTMVGFALFQLLAMKPFLEYLVEYAESNNVAIITSNLFALIICLLLMSAWFTELIGLDAIFGAFLFGLTIPRGSRLYIQCREHIEEFVLTFMLPLYFTLSGLKTNVTTITTGQQGAMVVLVCVCASAGKLFGCGLAAYFTGTSIRESSTIAVLMNTRGLVELIVLNVGMEAGILSIRTFSVMVIMCLFTTCMTGPLVSLIYPESMLQVLENESTEGIEPKLLKSESLDEVKLSTITTRLAVVIETLPQMQSTIKMLSFFIPHTVGSEFAVTAMYFIEATKTKQDEFLGLNAEGRLIRVDEETTDFYRALAIMKDPAAKKFKLLPLSGFCKANYVPVNAFRIEGDPSEYPKELKSIAANNDCTLICIPFRPTSIFARSLFWGALHKSASPVLLLMQILTVSFTSQKSIRALRPRTASLFAVPDLNTIIRGPESDEEIDTPPLFTNQSRKVLPLHRRATIVDRYQKLDSGSLKYHEVVVLLTGKHADLILLSFIPRFIENPINKVSVLIPADHAAFSKAIVDALDHARNTPAVHQNQFFIDIPSISTDYEGLNHDSKGFAYDLLVTSFVEPVISESIPTLYAQRPRSTSMVEMLVNHGEQDPGFVRLRVGMPAQYAISNLLFPELGCIGSKIYESTHSKSSLVLIVHESFKATAPRTSIQTEISQAIEATSEERKS